VFVCALVCASVAVAKETEPPNPLEGGLYDEEDEKYYRRNLDMDKSALLISQKGVLWGEHMKDMEEMHKEKGDKDIKEEADKTIGRISQKGKSFRGSSILWDRDDTLNALEDAVAVSEVGENPDGQLILYLGGKNTGKSFLLRTMAELSQNTDKKTDTAKSKNTVKNTGKSAGKSFWRRMIPWPFRKSDKNTDNNTVKNTIEKDGSDKFKNGLKAFEGRTVVRVDCLEESNLSELLFNAIRQAGGEETSKSVLSRLVTRLGKPVMVAGVVGLSGWVTAGVDTTPVVAAFSAMIGKGKRKLNPVEPTPTQILDEFIKHELENRPGKPPVIIFDEANRIVTKAILPKDAQHTDESYKLHRRNADMLDLMVRTTKQENMAHFVLASSEHSFVYMLKEITGLGNFDQNITETIYAGEVPPEAMLDLLKSEWGMGPNLAKAFVACYGGHIMDASQAASRLKSVKEKFEAIDGLNPYMIRKVAECVKNRAGGKRLRELMEELAMNGFAKLIDEKDDPHAELLSKANVAGVVNTLSTVVGLPEDVRAGAVTGLIPASQATRLVIAWLLRVYPMPKEK